VSISVLKKKKNEKIIKPKCMKQVIYSTIVMQDKVRWHKQVAELMSKHGEVVIAAELARHWHFSLFTGS
jgi:hypothetical protein